MNESHLLKRQHIDVSVRVITQLAQKMRRYKKSRVKEKCSYYKAINMNRIFSWFTKKPNLPLFIMSRRDFIESLIVQRRIKEFIACLQQKDDQDPSIDAFFHLLSTMTDDKYMSDIFELIVKKSRLKSDQLSKIIVSKVSRSIVEKNFDLCEKILSLPLQSIKPSLGTFEIIQLIHNCTNQTQLTKCLTILIDKNLPYDSEYFLWILIIIFEHYTTGDEFIIEYLLILKKNIDLLFTCYGNNNITPLMLFFHLYGNSKCQILIDSYISTIDDQTVLLQCDKWNRSYLMHLLCGKCEHPCNETCLNGLSDISDINKQLLDRCPNGAAILSRFSMLYKLGNRYDTPVKMVFTSQYCLALRVVLFNFFLENDPSVELMLNELFNYFPVEYIPYYWDYLKKIINNQNLNSILTSVLLNYRTGSIENIVRFLLKQGAQLNYRDTMSSTIMNMLSTHRSLIPFILLDYCQYIDVSLNNWRNYQYPRVGLYICRVVQCGYPSEFRNKFDELKATLSEQAKQQIEKFIDLKNPSRLSKLCIQKIRGSAKHLGDETMDKLAIYIPPRLHKSIIRFGYDECQPYFNSVIFTS